MAILPSQTIKSELAAGRLIRHADDECVQSCSYDLRIGTIFEDGQPITSTSVSASRQVVLKPGGIISMFTQEELCLPSDVCATVFPINAQSSRGLLVLNPGHVDPGYCGPITVKVLNISKSEKLLTLGEPIFTAIFDRLEEPTDSPYVNSSKSRGKREVEYAEKDLNSSPGSLLKLVGEPSDEHVKSLIRSHWMSVSTVGLSLGALIFAIIAALPVFKDAKQAIQGDSVRNQVGQDNSSAKDQSAPKLSSSDVVPVAPQRRASGP